MKKTPIAIVYLAMILFSIVSMWTTYKSLAESILPHPSVPIPLPNGAVYNCSIMALGLSLAIGLMLFALKLAVIDDQKRLNLIGIVGMTIIASISIVFNIDVLYRCADQDFFLRYSDTKMRSPYDDYLSKVQSSLTEKRQELDRQVAKQQGELESEIRGLRKKEAGYGSEARKEDYALTLLQKQAEVDLKAVDEALASKTEADKMLAAPPAQSLEEIAQLQTKIRVALTNLSGLTNVRLPDAVQIKAPFFAVFDKLFDWHSIGFKEVLFVFLGFLLDLGDIIGYNLIPNKPTKKQSDPLWSPIPDALTNVRPTALTGPEVIEEKSVARKPKREVAVAEPDQAPTFEVAESEGNALQAMRRRRLRRR